MELMTGFGLATAAGLNAYIPLLSMGLLDRYTSLVNLPDGWAWLANGRVIAIVAVLLVICGRRSVVLLIHVLSIHDLGR